MQELELTIEFLESLQFAWGAVIEQHNGVEIPIWYTALPTAKKRIKRIISVSSDLPRFKIGNENFIIVDDYPLSQENE